MEMHLSTTMLQWSTFPMLNFPSKPNQMSVITKSKFGFSHSSLKTTKLAKNRCACQLNDGFSDYEDDEYEDDEEIEGEDINKKAQDSQWKSIFLGEPYNSTKSKRSNKTKGEVISDLFDDSRSTVNSGSMDWCVRARRMALKSIESRGFSYQLEKMVTPKKKKKKKKRKSKNENYKRSDFKKINRLLDAMESDNEEEEEAEEVFTINIGDDDDDDKNEKQNKNDLNALKDNVANFADGIFEKHRVKAKAEFVRKLSKFSGPSDRKKEITLNKKIVQAESAEEVIGVISEIVNAVAKGLNPSPLNPLNIATALHRIAKNMEKVQMVETRRFGFARQKEMALLVGIGMTALPSCSGQGVSNIAWALSKIGGDILYISEMDRIADVAVTKVAEFNSQNLANIAGAFASMRHSSEALFVKLVSRAREIVETFSEREITQFLWACATLNVETGPFLDELDERFADRVGLLPNKEIENEDENLEDDFDTLEDDLENLDDLDNLEDDLENSEDELGNVDDELEKLEKELDDLLKTSSNSGQGLFNFTRDQVGNIAWSYAVMGQTGRPFFSNIWRLITKFREQRLSHQHREDVLFASQVYIANQCLKIENSDLVLKGDLAERIYNVGKTKRFNMKVSSLFQKDVAQVLISTGLKWVREYPIDGYTVDSVLVDEKLAFEIDGPTHFSRNSAMPLGHTMMKRRYIEAAGWKLVSLSHYEWEALDGEPKQLRYLRKILDIDELNNADADSDSDWEQTNWESDGETQNERD